jgi:hypothetical protein
MPIGSLNAQPHVQHLARRIDGLRSGVCECSLRLPNTRASRAVPTRSALQQAPSACRCKRSRNTCEYPSFAATAARLVDFVKTGMDAGIRFGPGTWPRLHAQKLLDEWLVPVCTPVLLRRHGPIAEARDLRRYKLLHCPYEPWTAWLLEGGADEVWPSSGPAFDDAIAIVRAAEAGQGLALARWSVVGDAVTMGQLAVAGRAVHSAHAYHFVCPPTHLALDKVAAFREWLVNECARFPAPPVMEGPESMSSV